MTNEKLEALGQAGAVTGFTFTPYAHTVGELTLQAKAEDIVAVMKHLRDDPACAFQAFVDITAVDWPQRERRFDIVYHLLSPTRIDRENWVSQATRLAAGEDTPDKPIKA